MHMYLIIWNLPFYGMKIQLQQRGQDLDTTLFSQYCVFDYLLKLILMIYRSFRLLYLSDLFSRVWQNQNFMFDQVLTPSRNAVTTLVKNVHHHSFL